MQVDNTIKKLVLIPMDFQYALMLVGLIILALGIGAFSTSRPGSRSREYGYKLIVSGTFFTIGILGYRHLVEVLYYIYGG